MSIAVYARMTKLPNVVGRVDYISNPERQENLLATFSTVEDPVFWKQLAADSQQAWRTTGGNRKTADDENDKCCEARELQGELPNSAMEMDLNKLASAIAQNFKEKTGAECTVAIHLNKSKKHLHYHLIFSERQKLNEPEIRYADRNAFIDENGVRKRTKKEILDADGKLRPGCKIIPKGEILSERYFGEKEDIFKSKGFLHDFKVDMADWINTELQPDKKRIVFDPNGPFLAQVHVGKGKPEITRKFEEYNRMVKAFNKMIHEGIMTEEEANREKTAIILAPDRFKALATTLASFTSKEAMEILQDTNLSQISNELLDKIEVNPGAPRTKQGLNEEKKRELRELYRLASMERQKARNSSGLDKNEHIARARMYSARIDKLRKELGYFREADFRRLLAVKEEERRKKRAQVFRARRWYNSLDYRAFSQENYIKELEKELRSMPILFLSKEEKAEKAALEKRIEEAKVVLQDITDERFRAMYQYQQRKSELKELRKACRQEKKEAAQYKKQNQVPSVIKKKKEISR